MTDHLQALPNLRRLFVEARTEAEENEYSRNAVCEKLTCTFLPNMHIQFYNLVMFISSVAVFSLMSQRMNGAKGLK